MMYNLSMLLYPFSKAIVQKCILQKCVLKGWEDYKEGCQKKIINPCLLAMFNPIRPRYLRPVNAKTPLPISSFVSLPSVMEFNTALLMHKNS